MRWTRATRPMAILLIAAVGAAWVAADAIIDLARIERERGELRRSAAEAEVLFANADGRSTAFLEDTRQWLTAREAAVLARRPWMRLASSSGLTVGFGWAAWLCRGRFRPGSRRAGPSSRRSDPDPLP